ncbi:MAG: hypothetical protein LUI14_13490 [Lachnospiraceae bacterium]|nr:hypothetical protein [Lachnospiraceae bacterium]
MSNDNIFDSFFNWTKDFLPKSLEKKIAKKQFYEEEFLLSVEKYEDSDLTDERYMNHLSMLSHGIFDIELYVDHIWTGKDLPCWQLKVNLGDKVAYERCEREKAENKEWLCSLEKGVFDGTARNNHLEDILIVFKKWIEPSSELDENESIYEWFFRWASIFIQEKRNNQKGKSNEPEEKYMYYVDTEIDGEEMLEQVSLDELTELWQFDIAIISNPSCDSSDWFVRLDLSNSEIDLSSLLNEKTSHSSVPLRKDDNLDVKLQKKYNGVTSILAQSDCEHLEDAFSVISEFIETRSEKA